MGLPLQGGSFLSLVVFKQRVGRMKTVKNGEQGNPTTGGRQSWIR